MDRVYFDNNATTPLAPEAREAMLPFLDEVFGNPSSGHHFGEKARFAIEKARGQVAGLLGSHSSRVIFTSGGTEANNLAIWSAVQAQPDKKHIISSQVEHASVLEPLQFYKRNGYDVELLPVDGQGGLDLDRLAAAIRPDTLLVSLIGANNETGVLWPVAKISGICRGEGVLFHCDAVQMAGKMDLTAELEMADYVSIAAHKLHGPKGVGALYAGRTAPVRQLIMGADQEGRRRAGTENVAGIVGFGVACECARTALKEYVPRVEPLRDALEEGILKTIADVVVNGRGVPRLPNTLNVSFRHCSSASMIQELDERGIAVSAHAACHSGDLDPSHVLGAMGVPDDYRHGTLRISLSHYSTKEEVRRLLSVLPDIVVSSRQGFAI